MANTDAKPVPIKGAAYRVTFAIYDADGDVVTAASSLDSEVSKDGGTFTDCTSEATEIATGSGVYYLDLTATEMNADTVAVIVKTATSGAKTTVIIFYPQESGDIKVDVQTWLGVAPNALSSGKLDTTALQPTVAGRTLDVSTTGEAGVDWANVGSPTTTVNLSATTTNVVNTATAVTTVNGLAANVITATSIASGALTAAKFAAGAFDAVWSVAARILTAGTNIVLAKGTGVTGFNDLSAAQVTTACTASTPVAASVSGSVGSVGPNGITASSLATDAVDELVDATWNELTSGHTAAGSTGKALSDAATAGGGGGGPTAAVIADAVWDEARSGHVSAGSFGEGITSVALAAQAKADVNAEVVDALAVDTYAEPSSVPAATASLKDKIGWQAVVARNTINQTANAQAIRNDADSATIGTASVSDDGVTATRGRFT